MRFDRFARRAATVVVAGLIAAAFAGGNARAASWLEKNLYLSGPNYDGDVPACESALGTISDRFETKEGRFWNSNLQILGYERVRQVAFSPWARGTIPRRFCTAVAMVSDGRKHRVDYYITEDGGEIGATWGVTWCVVGFDRNMAYSPACKMARP
ncbi:MAG: hypothetical protein JSR61_15205 [Proteobacteria bacterium]|nr:hypothetical protein [Pseudomonadota bacterium]